MLRCVVLLPFLWLTLSCLQTNIEVTTTVDESGAGTRTIKIVSRDGGSPADHPQSLGSINGAYTKIIDQQGELFAQASFESLSGAPSPFEFQLADLGSRPGSRSSFTLTDWGLFKHYRFSETIHDLVTPEDIAGAQEELVDVGLLLAAGSLGDLLGPDVWNKSRLKARLDPEIKPVILDWFVRIWKVISDPRRDEEVMTHRIAEITWRSASKIGLKLEPGLLQQAMQDLGDSELAKSFVGAVADWMELELQPAAPEGVGTGQNKGRRQIFPDFKSMMLGGEFGLLWEDQMVKKFGDKQAGKDWLEGVGARLSGLFGPRLFGLSGNPYRITLRVEMPGVLLKSNGYLSHSNRSFIEILPEHIYPSGAGIALESISWNLGKLAALPGSRIEPTNEDALHFESIVGGEQGKPDPLVLEALNQCIATWSLGPLEYLYQPLPVDGGSPEIAQGAADRARKLVRWLQGSDS